MRVIYTSDQLDRKSSKRPDGYRAEILASSTLRADGRREIYFSDLEKIEKDYGYGLGDRVQTVIHAGLDAVPMPAKTRTAIKQCGGCAKRKAMLNKAGDAIKAMLSPNTPPALPPPQMQPPTPPPSE